MLFAVFAAAAFFLVDWRSRPAIIAYVVAVTVSIIVILARHSRRSVK